MVTASADLHLCKHGEVLVPRVLLTATLRWQIAARLAMVFSRLGCQVVVVCPRQHPVETIPATARAIGYPQIARQRRLLAIIESVAPDLVVPCDDSAALHLQQLWLRVRAAGERGRVVSDLLTRSLGNPDSCRLAVARGELMAVAVRQGVRIPASAAVASWPELSSWLLRHGFPAVIKLDRTWGGLGTIVVRDMNEARKAFERLSSPPPVAGSMARTLLERDSTWLLHALKPAARQITVQEFIAGTPANRAVACWQGEVLAGLSVEAVQTQHATGPATVVRVLDNEEMSRAAVLMMRTLGASGLWGLDFMLAASDGAAHLLEINPRATPICHLSLERSGSLPAALLAKATAARPLALEPSTRSGLIAMFPGEVNRDPASPYLDAAFHDIPWEYPALARVGLLGPWSERGLLARARSQLRRWRPGSSSTVPQRAPGRACTEADGGRSRHRDGCNPQGR